MQTTAKTLYIPSPARVKYITNLVTQLRKLRVNSKQYLAVNTAINNYYVEEINAASAFNNAQTVVNNS